MPGRPRDPRVDRALMDHLVPMLAEQGPDGFTVDQLAARSGVGKAAIYRRFRTRDELVEAGFAAVNTDMPDVSDVGVRDALVALLQWLSRSHASGMTPTWLIGMQSMPVLKDLYMQKVVGPRRAALREVLTRGQQEGVVRRDLDLEAAVTCLSGPAILLGMQKTRGSAESRVDIEQVVDLVLCGLLNPEARASGS